MTHVRHPQIRQRKIGPRSVKSLREAAQHRVRRHDPRVTAAPSDRRRRGRRRALGVDGSLPAAGIAVFLVDATTPTRAGLVLAHLAVAAARVPAFVRAPVSRH